MPLSLSVKNAPEKVVKKLKERAARHHRSLQGELLAILEAAANEEPRPLTPRDVLAQVRASGIATPSSSAHIIRASREGRVARCPSPSLTPPRLPRSSLAKPQRMAS